MLVVADSSPMIALVTLEQTAILPALFQTIVLPDAVADELSSHKRPRSVQQFILNHPDWLTIHSPKQVELIDNLDPGECAAISLALELQADLLLIDERLGRRAALERHLSITGTVGLLELAARKNLIDLASTFELLKATDFWIDPQFLDERLRRFNE